jgi:hypothetical protein
MPSVLNSFWKGAIMPEPDFITFDYEHQLQHFLAELHRQIGQEPAPFTAPAATTAEGESYWLELNRFYYQSFVRDFLPPYQEALLAALRDTYQLHLDERSMQQQVRRLLHTYATLYNRLLAAGQCTEQTIAALTAAAEAGKRYEQARTVRFWQQMVNLKAECHGLKALFDRLYNYAGNTDIRLALKQFPGHISLASLLTHPELPLKPNQRFLQALMQDIGEQLAALRQLDFPLSQDYSATAAVSLAERDKKTLSALRNWCSRYYEPGKRGYLLELTTAKSAAAVKKGAAAYEAWLQALLTLLNTTWAEAFKQPVIFTAAQPLEALREANEQQLQHLTRWLNTAQPEIITLTAALEQTRAVLAEARQSASAYRDGAAEWHPELAQAYQAIAAAVEVADDLREEGENFYAALPAQMLQEALHKARQDLEENQTARRDLKKLMAPRGQKDLFPAGFVQLEHYPVKTGEILSPATLDIIRRQQPEAEAATGTGEVLRADGDIFVLRGGETEEYIIPEIEFAAPGT